MIKNQQTYYYDKQITHYILQFMALFSGFEVSVGKKDEQDAGLIAVPIHYSSHDRITHAIMANNTQNSPIRLPAFSTYVKDIDLAPELRKGVGTERRNTYVPVGGLIPNDVTVVQQRQPVPYKMQVELGIHVSNVDQHFQILEQILSIFDPMVTIQTSDSIFDSTRLTTVELTNINLDDLARSDNTNRIIKSILIFKMPIYLALPAESHHRIVEQIRMRVGMVNINDPLTDIVSSLDDQGAQYQTVTDAANIPFV
jgi:hypothetical protein